MKGKPIGVRLTPELEQKLREWSEWTHQRPSSIVRAVLASATSASLPASWVAVTPEERALLAVIE